MARKVKTPPRPPRKGARYRVGPPIDICGQDYLVYVDPKLAIEGECNHTDGIILIQPQSRTRMAEVLVHEVFHAIIEATGLKWMMRQRLKMTKAAYEKFEEDVIRVLAPAFHATFRRARWLRLPSLLTTQRHRRA